MFKRQGPLTIKIPGRRHETLGVVNTGDNFDSGVYKRTPEWMVSFSSLNMALLTGTLGLRLKLASKKLHIFFDDDPIHAESTTKDIETFTELFGWNAEMFRFVDGHESGPLLTSGGVEHTPLVLMIPSGFFAANAESVLLEGKLIKAITIIRLGYVNGKQNILQTIVFRNCRMIRFQQQLDRLILHFTVIEKEMMLTVFAQTGQLRGIAAEIVRMYHM